MKQISKLQKEIRDIKMIDGCLLNERDEQISQLQKDIISWKSEFKRLMGIILQQDKRYDKLEKENKHLKEVIAMWEKSYGGSIENI